MYWLNVYEANPDFLNDLKNTELHTLVASTEFKLNDCVNVKFNCNYIAKLTENQGFVKINAEENKIEYE